MRIYLDTSVYNRPFDNQAQPRIWLETLGLALILQMQEAGELELVNSSVLEYENSKNPFPLRKKWVERCLKLSVHYQKVDILIKSRAQEISKNNIAPIDALHLSCAEATASEYFVTCDDRVVRRYVPGIIAINPITFIMQITGDKNGSPGSK